MYDPCTIRGMTLLAIISFLILLISTLKYWVEFLGNFFSNLSVKKIIGALLFIGGCWLISRGMQTGDADRFILFAGAALVVGGIGAVIIYYDMAKDGVNGKGQYDELATLTKAYSHKTQEDQRPAGGHTEEKTANNKN